MRLRRPAADRAAGRIPPRVAYAGHDAAQVGYAEGFGQGPPQRRATRPPRQPDRSGSGGRPSRGPFDERCSVYTERDHNWLTKMTPLGVYYRMAITVRLLDVKTGKVIWGGAHWRTSYWAPKMIKALTKAMATKL